MNANSILNSDVLDILFDNRNKQYGAYTLRKGYNNRLMTAIGLMFSLVAVFIVCLSFKPAKKPDPALVYKGDGIILENVPPKAPKPIEKPVVTPPHAPGAPKPQVATIKSNTIDIVPDHTIAKTDVPTVDDQANKQISSVTTDGAPAGNTVQSTAVGGTGDGKGDGQAAAPEAPDENKIFTSVELMPEFPGGANAMTRFLLKNLRPMEGEEAKVIRVVVRFVVDRTGAVTGFEVVSSGGADYDKEVLRVLKKMPSWKPGRQNDHNVNVYMSLPVVFQTQAE